jgi:hypothetical protein
LGIKRICIIKWRSKGIWIAEGSNSERKRKRKKFIQHNTERPYISGKRMRPFS